VTKTVLTLILCIWAFANPVFAQAIEGAVTIPSEFDIRDRGWSQLSDTDEILEFVLSLVEAIAMTAVLAFHPSSVAHRRVSNDWQLPRSMFLYTLIGLVVGFLVVHHGVLIGFVVFGIGGLFRFRMETLSTSDTAQLIFVALIGLSIGLDLPVMALLLTIAAAAVLSVFSRSTHMSLEIKFEKSAEFTGNLARLRDTLMTAGFSIVSVTKSKFKPVAEVVLSSTKSNAREMLLEIMSEHQRTSDSGVEDWHVK